MSGSISLAASRVALPAIVAMPSTNAIGGPDLTVFIDLMTGKAATPAIVPITTGDKRQDDAAPGKSLPAKDDKKLDPVLAWLFSAPQLALPPAALPRGVPVALPALVAIAPNTMNALVSPQGEDAASPSSIPSPADQVSPAHGDTVAPCAAISPFPERAGLAMGRLEQPAALTPIFHPSLEGRGKDVKAILVHMPRGSDSAISQTPPVAQRMPVPAVASAPAVSTALFVLATTSDKASTEREDPATPLPLSAAPQPATIVAVAQAGDTQRQSLDTSQRDWPRRMIDHIETLRDTADANDTSIRLKPEALGRVDVAIKAHADGAISVRFTAEQPATRTLIADAAPQLAQAAEARGIRLSGTSVDLTGQGGDPRPRPEIERRQPIVNNLAGASSEDTETAGDGRIA